MRADAGKSSRKYDGAYFFIEPRRMDESGQTVALEAGNPGEFAGHTAAVMIAIGTAGATVPGLFLRQVGTAFLQ
jgi:hypothetical protein